MERDAGKPYDAAVSSPTPTVTIASADLSPLDMHSAGFADGVRQTAATLAAIRPQAVCLRGAPSSSAVRLILATVIRQQNLLLRVSTCRMDPNDPSAGIMAVIYRLTDHVATIYHEDGDQRAGLGVTVTEPHFSLVAANRQHPFELHPHLPAIIAGPAGLQHHEGRFSALTSAEHHTDVLLGAGVTVLERGVQVAGESPAIPITWAQVQLD